MKGVFYILFSINGFLYTQSIDVDSIFAYDIEFQNFIYNLNPDSLDNIPASWDSAWNYKNLDWISLNLRMYKGIDTSSKKPTIVFFPGGGWTTRSLNQYKQYAYYFSRKGYNTFSVMYRVLQDSSIVTPYDALEDTKSALTHLRQNASKLEIDSEKIVGIGMSAGGHLISAATYISGNNNIDSSISAKPNALILQSPAIDLSINGWLWGHQYLGNDWQAFSPLHNINNCSSIPSIILSGTNDSITPFTGMERWDSTYKQMGCNNQLYKFTSRSHGFANYSSSKSGINHRDFYYSVYLINKFLIDEGFCIKCTSNNKAINLNKKIKLSPNPFSTSTKIELSLDPHILTIYNILGKKVRQKQVRGTTKIERGNLQNGVYFIEIRSKKQMFSGKFIIK